LEQGGRRVLPVARAESLVSPVGVARRSLLSILQGGYGSFGLVDSEVESRFVLS
jgi:hypothetical protein